MSFQRNVIIGVGALGALIILGNVVSAESSKPQKVLGGDDPAYLSVVNPYGINPATGNTYCEDNDNCPDDGFGEPEKEKEDKSVVLQCRCLAFANGLFNNGSRSALFISSYF